MNQSQHLTLIDIHCQAGEKRYGKRRWSQANLGWFSDLNSISTKVYALNRKKETMIFTTSFIEGRYRHDEEPYR